MKRLEKEENPLTNALIHLTPPRHKSEYLHIKSLDIRLNQTSLYQSLKRRERGVESGPVNVGGLESEPRRNHLKQNFAGRQGHVPVLTVLSVPSSLERGGG